MLLDIFIDRATEKEVSHIGHASALLFSDNADSLFEFRGYSECYQLLFFNICNHTFCITHNFKKINNRCKKVIDLCKTYILRLSYKFITQLDRSTVNRQTPTDMDGSLAGNKGKNRS